MLPMITMEIRWIRNFTEISQFRKCYEILPKFRKAKSELILMERRSYKLICSKGIMYVKLHTEFCNTKFLKSSKFRENFGHISRNFVWQNSVSTLHGNKPQFLGISYSASRRPRVLLLASAQSTVISETLRHDIRYIN
jgi:hypothetical protein